MFEGGQTGLAKQAERPASIHGIIVVRVQDQEGLSGREFPRRGQSVRGAARPFLHGKADREPFRYALTGIVIAYHIVLRTHNQADLLIAGIRQSVQDIIEKRTADGNHGLESCLRDLDLGWVERPGICIGLPHARSEAARQDYCFARPLRTHAVLLRAKLLGSRTIILIPRGDQARSHRGAD